MFRVPSLLGFLCIPALSGFCWADTASYEFNGDLSAATGQEDLEAVGYPGVAGTPGVTFATSDIGGEEAQIAQLTKGTALVVRHGMPANGGGDYLNQYTIIMDVLIPADSGWISLYQTNQAFNDEAGEFDLSNSNDGDWFINNDHSAGIGISGNYGGAIEANTWYRLALTVDGAGFAFTSYIDGAQVQQNLGDPAVDGRWSLYNTTNPDPYDWFFLFADESGDASEMGEVWINSFCFLDSALSSEQIAALGGPSAAGIHPAGCPDGLYKAPKGGWDYAFEADPGDNAAGGGAFDSLDGTWDHDNGSDQWDGSEIGAGNPGGVSLVSGCFLRLQETGDPRDYGQPDPGSNRKIYLGHDLSSDGASSSLLDDGVTLNFRARVPVPNGLDDLRPDGGGGIVPYPEGGDGYLLHDGGKGNIGVKQAAGGLVSFSLATLADTGGLAEGLLMNNLNGNSISGDVDSGEGGTPNVLALNPTEWHEYWVTIAAGGEGTHQVTIYLDGATDPAATFDVTAGSGSDYGDISYVALGTGSTGQSGALDVDFLRVGLGATAPGSDAGLPGETCDTAVSLDLPAEVMGSTADAEPDNTGDCGATDAPALWYSVTGTGNCITAQLCGSSYDTKLSVHEGACGSLTCVAENDDFCGLQSSVTFDTVAGTTYLIRVFGFDVESGDFVLNVTECPAAPENDTCDAAIDLELVNGMTTVAGSTLSAETDPENDGCGDSDAGGVWYQVAGTGGTMTASTCNAANYDSRLSVFSGDCGALECVQENDDADGCAGNTSFVSWPSNLGESYLILVHGFADRAGDFELTVTGEAPPCLTITTCRPDQQAKTVTLEWVNLEVGQVAFGIFADGVLVGQVGPDVTTFVHKPVLDDKLTAIEYAVVAGGVPEDLGCIDFCTAVLSPGSVCLADDFDDYEDDLALEFAGWLRVNVDVPETDSQFTLTNPGRRANPPTFNGTPTTGQFLISDNDAGGGSPEPGTGVSWDIWSPVFSAEGKDALWLHLDVSAVLNNNGKAVFDIDVSTDEGKTWTNAFRRVAPSRVEAEPLASTENSDGFFGRLDVDLSSAAGQPAVRFRVRHFEPNFDWWIAFDNVIVDDVSPESGGTETLLASEGFDAGIPAGWAVLSGAQPPNTGTDTWNTDDPCGRTVAAFPHQDGRGAHRLTPSAPFAILDSDCDPDPAQSEFLVTPLVDCSQMTEVFVHYKSESVLSSAVQGVVYSPDAGQTLFVTFDYSGGGLFDGGEDPVYAERIFKLPLAAGSPAVLVAFVYIGQDDWWWAVDDVKITGTPPEPKGSLQLPGDCNQDGTVDISDAVCLFGFLFLNRPDVLPCGDGTAEHPSNFALLNWDGDDDLDLSDGIAELNFLFQGGLPHALGRDCIVLPECEEICQPAVE